MELQVVFLTRFLRTGTRYEQTDFCIVFLYLSSISEKNRPDPSSLKRIDTDLKWVSFICFGSLVGQFQMIPWFQFSSGKIKYFRSEILDVKEKLQQYQIMFRNPEIQKQANEAMNAL